ncbi:MAG: lipase [Thiotrichales bacterium]|nr:lipase [Thiotrichales bacterium]
MKLLQIKKLALVSLVALLAGCGGSEEKITLDPVEGTAEQVADTRGSVVMNFVTSNIPFPHDALFSGSTDGTLNIPVDDETNYADPTVALNALDGFSTTSPITFSLTKAVDTSGSLATGVKIYPADVAIVEGTRVVTAVGEPLSFGQDYFITPTDAELKTVAIIPLKPLEAKKTYLVVVNDQLLDIDGEPMIRGVIFNRLAGTESLVGSSLEALEPLRQLTNAQLAALASASVDVATVVASWSFTTQSTSDVLETVKSSITSNANTSLALVDSGLDTSDVGGLGAAKIYAGTIDVPYYLTAPTDSNPLPVVSSFWQAANEQFLTQFNSTPVATSTVTIPVVMTKPQIGTKPAEGWPVVIFQHGVTQNRGNVLAVADALANAGYAAIAIDMPLHGITPDNMRFAALRMAEVERTFDVDLVTQDENGSVTIAAPDGVVDSSGRHFINLSSLLTTRDNLRQAVADLMQLKSALSSATLLDSAMNFEGVTELDSSKVAFVGHSLGGIVGGMFTDLLDDELQSAVFAMAGTQASYLLAGSPAFGPEIVAGLAAQGVEAGTAEFNQFLLAAQTVIDSADPVNYVANIASPSLMIEVVGDGVDDSTKDQVVPNSVPTAPLAGTEPWIILQEMATLTGTGLVPNGKGALRFNSGDHSSILLPDTDLTATVTMQEAMASFVKTEGAAVSVSDNSTIQQ